LICRSLFHYYSDYSTPLPSVCFLSVLPFPLYTSCVLPLCASLVFFLLRERGRDFVKEKRKERGREGGRKEGEKERETEREREREYKREYKNKQTYLLCFLKKEKESIRESIKINRLTFCVF
jgi:hypothetical protein